MRDEDARVSAIGTLAPYLPIDTHGEALAAARTIRNDLKRADALDRLIPHLAEAQRAEVAIEALAAARRCRTDYLFCKLVGRLILHLPRPMREAVVIEAVAAARSIQNADARLAAFIQLVSCP
jgi:hypothetical protein